MHINMYSIIDITLYNYRHTKKTFAYMYNFELFLDKFFFLFLKIMLFFFFDHNNLEVH